MARGIRITRGVRSVLRQLGRIKRSELLLVVFLFLLTSNGATAGKGGNRNQATFNKKQCPKSQEITPCSCRAVRKGLNIACDNIDAKQFESTLDVLKKNSYQIFWFRARNAVLPKIQNFAFLGIEMEHLSMIRSNISHVDRSSLSALASTLDTLDLANNNIKVVPTHALSTLKSLTFLNLNNNEIRILENNSFAGMTLLKRLNLYENKIHRIHVDAFKGIGNKLTRLNLGKNQLNKIPTDTFHPLVNLELLDLHENKIEHIPDGAFEGLHRLDMLKLEYNQITSIQQNVFKDLNMLTSLNIEHNRIKSVDDQAFAGLESNLGWLELGHNNLDHIPAHALTDLHSLRQLDLEDNMIKVMEEHDFRGYGSTLKYIYLNKNQIKVIPESAFEDLHSIEWLKLSNNMITTVTKDTIQPILDTITFVDISYNPLKCDCDVLWMNEWLSNPYNKISMEKTLDHHRCTTHDGKSHIIHELTEFDCPHHKKLNLTSHSCVNCKSTLPPTEGVSTDDGGYYYPAFDHYEEEDEIDFSTSNSYNSKDIASTSSSIDGTSDTQLPVSPKDRPGLSAGSRPSFGFLLLTISLSVLRQFV